MRHLWLDLMRLLMCLRQGLRLVLMVRLLLRLRLDLMLSILELLLLMLQVLLLLHRMLEWLLVKLLLILLGILRLVCASWSAAVSGLLPGVYLLLHRMRLLQNLSLLNLLLLRLRPLRARCLMFDLIDDCKQALVEILHIRVHRMSRLVKTEARRWHSGRWLQ